MKDHIVKTITAYLDQHKPDWKTVYRLQLHEAIAQLQPDKPEDNLPGYVAYHIDGKPRMKIKTARFLGKKLQLNSGFLEEHQIQSLAQSINALLFPDARFNLLDGQAIVDAYSKAVGGGSCMTGCASEFVGMYALNPARFKLLTVHQNGNSGRALVSKLDNGKCLMDRIYADSELASDQMVEYAKTQKWYYRLPCGRYNDLYLGDQHIEDYSEFVVSDIRYYEGQVPYMDTLHCYVYRDGGKITIFHPRCSRFSSDGTLDRTDGCIEDKFYCDCCQNHHSGESHAVEGDNVVCDNCFENYYSCCDSCETYFHQDDLYWMENYDRSVCRYCRDENYRVCDDCGEYFESQDLTEVHDGNEVCTDCLADGYDECELCGACVPNDRVTLIQMSDEDTPYCDECFDSKCFTCRECGGSFLLASQSSEHSKLCTKCASVAGGV